MHVVDRRDLRILRTHREAPSFVSKKVESRMSNIRQPIAKRIKGAARNFLTIAIHRDVATKLATWATRREREFGIRVSYSAAIEALLARDERDEHARRAKRAGVDDRDASETQKTRK